MIAAADASPATVDASMMPGARQTVSLDDAGQHLPQLIARRIVGVLTELLDAVGEARVGEHHGDALHRAVETALGDRLPNRVGIEIVASYQLTCRIAMLVIERGDDGGQLVVGRRLERAVEQAKRLQSASWFDSRPERVAPKRMPRTSRFS